MLDWLKGNFQNQCEVLAQREKQGQNNRPQELCQEDESNDRELSEGNKDISYNLWDNPLGLMNKWDPDTAAQEVLSCLSTLGPEAAAETVADLPSTAPATANAMGSAPAASAVARDPEAQEEAMAASPAFGKQVRTAGAESQAAALYSPCSPSRPLPSWPEAHGLSGQQMGAVVGSVLSAPEAEGGAWPQKSGKTHSSKSCPKGKLAEPKTHL